MVRKQKHPPPKAANDHLRRLKAGARGKVLEILQFGVRVRTDFAIQIDFFVLRGNPFHGKAPWKSDLRNSTVIIPQCSS